MKMRRKSDLPQKLCKTCGRPFVWRKKWAKDWDQFNIAAKNAGGIGIMRRILPEDSSFGNIFLPK